MINFAMSKEQQLVRNEVAKLVKGVVTDTAHDMDEERRIPGDALQKAWELGFSISMIPESYGGFGLKDSPTETALIFEELACGDMAYALAVMMPSLFIHPLAEMGTDAKKKKYLPLYCGEAYKACTLAIQEPHVGFDPVALKTIAERREGA